MRIGFDGKRATQNFRGLGSYSRGLLEGLLEYSSHELFLYSPPVKEERGLQWLAHHQGERLQLRTPENFLEQKFSAFWRSFTLAPHLRKDHLDLYHGLSHEIPVGLGKQGLKSIVTIHDLIFIRYPEFFPWIDRLTYKRKFSYACKNADKVLAICEQTKQDIVEFLGVDENKILVHHQSCDPIFYHTSPASEREEVLKRYGLEHPFVLSVGAFEPRKNQLRLIEAFALIAAFFPHDLVLIGQGKSYLEECKKRAGELNLSGRVRFLSGVPFSELPLFYQTADLFCLPSLFEGFGIPLIEALFSKTPVLTSHGSCAETAGPHSAYADPLSVQDISDQMSRVLSSPEQRGQMRTKGHEFVQKFHRKHSTEKLLECYQQLF